MPSTGRAPTAHTEQVSVLGEGRKGVTGREGSQQGGTGPHRSNQPVPVLTELNGDRKIPRMVLFLTKECSAREKKEKKKTHSVPHLPQEGNKIEACFSRPHLRAKDAEEPVHGRGAQRREGAGLEEAEARSPGTPMRAYWLSASLTFQGIWWHLVICSAQLHPTTRFIYLS